MIRLGLRLTVNGGREAIIRLVVTAAAVAIGVGLLLMALAGMNAVQAQNDRTAWLDTGAFPGPGPVTILGSTSPAAAQPLWWELTIDHFGSQEIDQVDVAATGPQSPVPPGIPHLPGPGQYYVSPALSRLLHTTPAAELGDRFPGVQVGTIGSAALPSPKSLIIVAGRTAGQMAQAGASQVAVIDRGHNVDGPVGLNANKLKTVLAVGALALLFPVLIFIATATRLAAARREQRFAALRLVGATPRQVSTIAAAEASLAALAGVALGFGVFFLVRPVLTNVPFTGAPFAPGDLSLGVADIVLVAVGVPVAAALAARVSLRRVQISPLGVSRRVTTSPPRALRLLPLAAGLAELGYFVWVGSPSTTNGQILAYLSGCLLIMVGLVLAGPWLTMVGSRVMAQRAARPSALIAGRRLSDNPRAAFRSVSGLIIALFATSVSVGIITTILDYHGASTGPSTLANNTLVETLYGGITPTGQEITAVASIPPGLVTAVGSISGVEGVTVVHVIPHQGQGPDMFPVSCAQLAHTPALGRCAPGASVAVITGNLNSGQVTGPTSDLSGSVWHAVALSLQSLQNLPVRAVAVEAVEKGASLEQARTTLETGLPGQPPPVTLGELSAANARLITELKQMTDVVLIVSLVIAGCSLAVSVTAGVNDRKRPFSLLRLAGVPVKVLRRVVALEAAVPLVVISVLSAGMGLVAAALFLNSQLGETLRPPGVEYYVIVAGGLVASLGIIASTLPLIERITGPEVARNE